jgi:hypothetical protein
MYDFNDFCERQEAVVSQLLQFIGSDCVASELLQGRGRRGNPSVPFHLEETLIFCNKVSRAFQTRTGKPLQLRLFGKTLNGRVLVQYVLPKFCKGSVNRDMTEIRDFYSADWARCRKMLRSFD